VSGNDFIISEKPANATSSKPEPDKSTPG
jgi:hypothetical protein